MEDNKLKNLAERVLKNAKNECIIGLRFLDVAISGIVPKADKRAVIPYSDGKSLYYDVTSLLKNQKQNKAYALRLYLHILMHMIFAHPYYSGRINNRYFDLACDIAAENVVLSIMPKAGELPDDFRRQEKLKVFLKYIDKLTAHTIYKYFLANEPSLEGERELIELFCLDNHEPWKKADMEISLSEWQKISERIKADIKTFSKESDGKEGLSENLEEATKDTYDYTDILSRFCVMGEDIKVNDEEFDYIYYTYGLSLYENMPLVEPLEYQDVKKIKEFAICLDTSASCQGNTVKNFLNKTYSIIKNSSSFFKRVNIHIIQCDNMVQSDTVIESDEDFEEFLKNGKLTGFGSTDFRPAFEYVDSLIDEGKFTNLKGLIYFTDGYGIYPEHMPEYEAMFVFLDEDERRGALPPWAIKVVLDIDEIGR